MAKQKLPGLYWDKTTGKGAIDKRIPGKGRVRHRFTARSWQEAEREYHSAIANAPQQEEATGALLQRTRTWREAATKYLTEETKKSLEREADILKSLDPYIGDMPIDQIHDGTLQKYISERKTQGIKSGTIKREFNVVRRILNLAARSWRDFDNRPWLMVAPLIRNPDWHDSAKPYPITWEEQRKLIQAMPDYLAKMALFAASTGVRQGVICALRWEWEITVPELNTTVFLVPGENTKNGTDFVLVLNKSARSLIDMMRGEHPDLVFTRSGKPVSHMYNSAWKRAWKAAGLPTDGGILKGPHNLRHTFARRLRVAGVSLETRKALLHHYDGDITIHYSPADIREMIEAAERVTETRVETILRIVRAA